MRRLGGHFNFAWDGLTGLYLGFACFCALLIPSSRFEWGRELGLFEMVQVAIIVAGGVQARSAGLDANQSPAWRRFWNWSVWCWVLVLGRTFSWGRVFFNPTYPRLYFRLVAVALVTGMVVHFFRAGVGKEACALLFRTPFPFWILLVSVLAFLASDAVEHTRFGIVVSKPMRDFIEECMEMPVFAGLFCIARSLIASTAAKP